MARDAVDAAVRDLGRAVPESRTADVPLLAGGDDEVRVLAEADPVLAGPIPGAGHHVMAAAVHACTHQGALDLDDILARRMRVAIEVPDRGRAAAAAVAPVVAPVLGWSDARAAEEVARYVRLRDAEAAAEAAPDDATARERYREVMQA
jgi:glycerol-3-phosphate dehydrogenase